MVPRCTRGSLYCFRGVVGYPSVQFDRVPFIRNGQNRPAEVVPPTGVEAEIATSAVLCGPLSQLGLDLLVHIPTHLITLYCKEEQAAATT